MTAAKSPHYSGLSSLPSFTSFFALCTHPFTCALLQWLTPTISWGISTCLFQPPSQSDSHQPVTSSTSLRPQWHFCSSHCLLLHHQVQPVSLKTSFSRVDHTPLIVHLHTVLMHVSLFLQLPLAIGLSQSHWNWQQHLQYQIYPHPSSIICSEFCN